MTPLWLICIQLSESSSGVIIDKETAQFLVLDHTGHRVRRLTSAAGRLTVPPPTRSLPGYLVSKYGVQAPATNQEVYLLVGTPHWAILPWARYCRIDPLGLNQNARWTDLPLVTGLTGQLRKGQFSSHRSTDWCTLNTHRSYRDPVIRVPVRPVPEPGTGTRCPVTPGILGTPGQTRCNRSHREHRSHRVHHPHWAILSWACYCRIDSLGLNQNAQWTDLLLATGLTGQLRKGQFSSHLSTDQCTLNIHRSHRDPVIPVPVRPVPGTGTRCPGTPGQTRRNRSESSKGTGQPVPGTV